MRPIQIAAMSAAASFVAGTSGIATASAVSTVAARGHLSPGQFAALHAKLLPFVGYAKPAQPVKIMVHLPLRNKAQAIAFAADRANPRSANYHKWLTRGEFEQRFGPPASELGATAAALRAGGFTVTGVDSQFVRATAPAATIERFFNTRIGLVRDGSVLHVDARNGFTVPLSLARFGAQVIGLNAMVHPHYAHELGGRSMPAAFANQRKLKLDPAAIWGPVGPYFEGELYQAYGQPAQTYANGSGEHIAIVGYSDSTDSENQTLWCSYGLGPSCGNAGVTLAPYPVVNHHDFAGYIPPDTPGDGAPESLEASLDAQMAGGSAPGATIDQYGADYVSNTGFLDAYSYITTNNVDDIITTSYTQCELDFVNGSAPFSYLQSLDDVFVQGTNQGETWLFASGDYGAYGCAYEGDTVDLATSALASDPNVTAVGGTTALTTTYFDGGYGTGYAAETSYSDSAFNGGYGSGGGVSQLFLTPSFQTLTGLPPGTPNKTYGAPYGTGRQTPDIAMHMGGPSTGPFSGVWVVSGLYSGPIEVVGTSAASPELAGWLAVALNAANADKGGAVGPRLGSGNELFYALEYYGYSSTAFNQYIPGDNLYTYYRPSKATPPGYNQVIGLGTPRTYNILNAVNDAATYVTAGDTFTASNP